MRVPEVSARVVCLVLVAEHRVGRDGALADKGYSVHVGGAALVVTMPMNTSALVHHMVCHVHNNVIS